MPEPITLKRPVDVADRTLASDISDRLSQELVIAFVGPVGSGVSTSAAYLAEILSHHFGYDVAPTIKLSTFIRNEARRVGLGEVPSPLSQYINHMQDAGNKLRDKFGNNYLAEKAVERIAAYRKEKNGYAANGTMLPGRRAYIIDSIKNLEELEILRQIYRDTLCVVGVFAPDAMRKTRLIYSGADENEVRNVLDRDLHEVATFGQNTRKIFVQSDFFICNDKKLDELKRRLHRYLEIIFDTSIHTPTRHESAMYEASAAMAGSACMSRQVGAALISEQGELISVGWNDVPKFRGGIYTEDDQFRWDVGRESIQDNDHRCFKWGMKICHNDTRRTSISDGIAKKIANSGLMKSGTTQAQIRELLKGNEVDDLTEFSRSIHAEMEAILAVAREGKHSLVGATLFTTTYPCHNCARHIVAAGISSVVYIEPYRKSLAIALHHDAITEDPDDKTKVVFRQYDGIAPQHYMGLFKPKRDRKNAGRVAIKNPLEAVPLFQVPLDGPVEYESMVIANLSEKEDTIV
ncbi:anti-phage dCTP deaminase [Tardiphaga sp. 862_B3_N4_1]|uniref:anti-phage dCTP deaminase n=1 Tax=Tardiphaga sp. 862_B3_N4_1 TaxID=3240764 RepID=UPI003F23B0BB